MNYYAIVVEDKKEKSRMVGGGRDTWLLAGECKRATDRPKEKSMMYKVGLNFD